MASHNPVVPIAQRLEHGAYAHSRYLGDARVLGSIPSRNKQFTVYSSIIILMVLMEAYA